MLEGSGIAYNAISLEHFLHFQLLFVIYAKFTFLSIMQLNVMWYHNR